MKLASTKQTYLLKSATGIDFRRSDITAKEAFDLIKDLKLYNKGIFRGEEILTSSESKRQRFRRRHDDAWKKSVEASNEEDTTDCDTYFVRFPDKRESYYRHLRNCGEACFGVIVISGNNNNRVFAETYSGILNDLGVETTVVLTKGVIV